MAETISVAFVYFKATTLAHLERAWYSLSQQDFTGVGEIVFLDNDTPDDYADVLRTLAQHPMPVPVRRLSHKHGHATRTHSWSVNMVCRFAAHPLVFFLRSDYLLTTDCLRSLRDEYLRCERPAFLSGWCWQTAYDRAAKPLPLVDLDAYPWREQGAEILPDLVPGYCFHETDQDAGVWLVATASMEAAGWMNEHLTSWGYQQSTFQRALVHSGTSCYTIPRYLFVHQSHGFVPRDFDRALAEYQEHGNGV